MTFAPGSTWLVTKGCSEAEDPSASTAIRHRPIPFGSLTSTAIPVRTFLPPARPASPPPAPGSTRGRLARRRQAPQPVQEHLGETRFLVAHPPAPPRGPRPPPV